MVDKVTLILVGRMRFGCLVAMRVLIILGRIGLLSAETAGYILTHYFFKFEIK